MSNLGFFAIARQGQWNELLGWWSDKLYSGCVADPDHGLFVDQHWCDLMPGLFENVVILRDPGYNVAYWNLKSRSMVVSNNEYFVEGVPLIFFHFSGYSPERPDIVSKHDEHTFIQDVGPEYVGLFEAYRAQLEEEEYAKINNWPYAYGTFSDGVPIPDELRVCLRTVDPEAKQWSNPYEISSPDSFRQWAISPVPNQSWLSQLALAVYQCHPDLQKTFPYLSGSYE